MISLQLENMKVLTDFHINDNVKYKIPDKLEVMFGVIENFALNSHGEIMIGVRFFGEWRPDTRLPEAIQFFHHSKIHKINKI